ncbi:MAG: transporter substrate-binding domain-containing protein [Thermoclostridium sp.]|nr:transporter substrate-binding domain-containing protein [Thermoclostridium sp.]
MMRKFFSFIVILVIGSIIISAPGHAKNSQTQWTDEELAFLSEHPVITLGVDPQFIPFEFIDESGEYKGIATDYLALITQRTGIRFQVTQGLTWPEVYDKALLGDIDVLPAISKTAEREQHFLFSEPYYYFKRVIVIRDTDKGISTMEDLDGQTVAVQRNSSHHSYLLSYPRINLSLYDSVEVALTAVANGTERAFIGNLATTNYLIRSNGLTNLKFIAFEAEKQQALYFAVRKDWPVLVSILNKALDTITQEEKFAIHSKWIGLDQKTDYGPMIRIIIIIGTLTAIITAVSFFWIIRLRKEVRTRELVQKDLEKAKQEADTANEFKSSFMARMSHEIRTPLNAITGMAYLLKKTGISITQKMYIERITQASSNMLSIINDILDFSKIEAGKVDLEVTSFSMDQVIQDVVNIISYRIEEKKLGFRLSKDPNVPNWFFGDSKRLEQILLNILNNAVKFTINGEISIDIRLIAKESEKAHLSFSVMDTGIGMTKEQIDSLFEPFSQADTSINRRFGGSGLGLSIVKNLVEMMGGKIQVFSTPGEGSTFVLQLSFAIDKEKEEEYVKTLAAGHFKSVRTLILEKTGANMNLIESYLRNLGMHCELTTSQASAMSMLEAADGNFAKPFDLFILDYETPSEGGFKFLESVRNHHKIVKQPKVIMLLPMMREDLFDQLGHTGVDIGIGKPIIPSILLNAILDIFGLKAVSASQPAKNMEMKQVRLDKQHTVLVAEDNKTNQLIAKSLLQQAGVDVLLADDGKAAVDLFTHNSHQIALILMDLHMPVMNGYEAAQEIRKISQKVPIVAMTADVILGVKEKCVESGIYQYISKPFDPDRFIETVLETLQKTEVETREVKILDTATGLKNLGGDQKVYQQVLNEYISENKDILDKLSQMVAEKSYSDAAQTVHKVKSSTATIGAGVLYDLFTNLQKAFENENQDEILPLFNRLLLTFQQLISEMTIYLNE